MKKLILKEFKLSINKFITFTPVLFAALLLIPQWIYIIAFMYVFWMAVPMTYSEYNAQNDLTFTQLLPVSKSNIVISKIIAFVIIELLHIVFGILFAIINNTLFDPNKFAFDLNFAFFGNVFIMYAIFNIIFFPIYFKTAFFFGKSAVIGSITAILYAIGIELLNIFVKPLNSILESPVNILIQIGIFLFSIILFIITLLFTIKISIKRFENRI